MRRHPRHTSSLHAAWRRTKPLLSPIPPAEVAECGLGALVLLPYLFGLPLDQVRLALSVLAYKLENLWRRLGSAEKD
jgi:hypothetical protein